MFIKAFTNSNSGFNLGAYSMTEKKSNLQLINISMQQTPGNYKHFGHKSGAMVLKQLVIL